jgi:hypothetical protein
LWLEELLELVWFSPPATHTHFREGGNQGLERGRSHDGTWIIAVLGLVQYIQAQRPPPVVWNFLPYVCCGCLCFLWDQTPKAIFLSVRVPSCPLASVT